MTISTRAAAERESARAADGTFGHQQHAEAAVSLDRSPEPASGATVSWNSTGTRAAVKIPIPDAGALTPADWDRDEHERFLDQHRVGMWYATEAPCGVIVQDTPDGTWEAQGDARTESEVPEVIEQTQRMVRSIDSGQFLEDFHSWYGYQGYGPGPEGAGSALDPEHFTVPVRAYEPSGQPHAAALSGQQRATVLMATGCRLERPHVTIDSVGSPAELTWTWQGRSVDAKINLDGTMDHPVIEPANSGQYPWLPPESLPHDHLHLLEMHEAGIRFSGSVTRR